MRILINRGTIKAKRISQNDYPAGSMLFSQVLLYLSPFVSDWLAALVMAVCVYRVFRYDAKVFATDYCLLVPVCTLFQVGGRGLLPYLCVIAAVWYFVRGGIRANAAYVFLIILMNYLLTRMGKSISNYVLCFGQMVMTCILLTAQDEGSAERSVKAFCNSLLISSIYGLVFRNTHQIAAIRGPEAGAYWGSLLTRFKGILGDANYYMALLIVGLALLVKLMDCGKIRKSYFLGMGLCFTFFGILTYSKTFMLMFMGLGLIYIAWQFGNRKIIRGICLTLLAVFAAYILLFSEYSPFSVALERIARASNISDLTTGRSDIFVQYLERICEDAVSLFFGKGLWAESLAMDPHNLYLEITYYLGLTGLLLIVAFYISMVRMMAAKSRSFSSQNIFAKYVVLLCAAIIFMALHGVFSVVVYGIFFLALLAMMLGPKREVS